MPKQIMIGNVRLGGGKIAVQSMTTEKTSDVEKSVAQILRLKEAGCDIVRVAVADEGDARALPHLKVGLPVVADVHFSARLAVLAVENGADKLRINPGNLGGKDLETVASCVRAHNIPVRVGANTGSLEQHAYAAYGRSAEALAESALENARTLEKYGVEDIVLSVKASDAPTTVKAYRIAAKYGYPLHLGVTEAGGGELALVKSAAGIGSLLMDGIGDTIRVSLSEDPVREVEAAHTILRACGLEQDFVEVISCPTCGRCEYDCMGMAARVSKRVENVRKRLKIAVMGCVVNGPGEARECDLGIAGGREKCVVMQRGKAPVSLPASEAERYFFARLEELL